MSPFEITQKISPVAYHLWLPGNYNIALGHKHHASGRLSPIGSAALRAPVPDSSFPSLDKVFHVHKFTLAPSWLFSFWEIQPMLKYCLGSQCHDPMAKYSNSTSIMSHKFIIFLRLTVRWPLWGQLPCEHSHWAFAVIFFLTTVLAVHWPQRGQLALWAQPSLILSSLQVCRLCLSGHRPSAS